MNADTSIAKPHYTNFLARLLLKNQFENQWIIPEPPAPLVNRMLRVIETYWLRVDTSDIRVDRPIFILSLPRCGSSMLQDIICTLPQVCYTTNIMHTFRDCFCAAEYLRKKFGFNVRGERFLKDSIEVDGGSPADSVGTWAEWFKQDPFETDFSRTSEIRLNDEDKENIREGIKRVIWSFGKEATRFECKTPALLPHARLLQEIFPDAKFIHLVRDARASANSLLKLHRLTNEQLIAIRKRKGVPAPEAPFVPYPRLPKLQSLLDSYGPDDIRTTAHLWNEGVDFIRQTRSALTNFHEVRYEDILADPDKEIFKLIDFCELPRPGTDNKKFRDKIGGVGVVHHKNRYGDFSVIEEICRDNMQRFGYL
ncbi:MAG: hypothetical protein C0616_11590 [Desulfuromonas sp.]|mgnify:CR=1 FL=1|nr:MAG: hypothetical protein C0616_11590 [Desulfuromonas sp.]